MNATDATDPSAEKDQEKIPVILCEDQIHSDEMDLSFKDPSADRDQEKIPVILCEGDEIDAQCTGVQDPSFERDQKQTPLTLHHDHGDERIDNRGQNAANLDDLQGEIDEEKDEIDGLKKYITGTFKKIKGIWTRCVQVEEEKDSEMQAPSQPLPLSPTLLEEFSEDEYKFTHAKRGRAVIINNENFSIASGCGNRPGSSQDASRLKEVFKTLGFEVRLYHDLTAQLMFAALEKARCSYAHEDADCFAVAILSHGDRELDRKAIYKDVIFGVDGELVSTASIIAMFNDFECPKLKGKPRLFFLQACRGQGYDHGQDVQILPDNIASHGNTKQDNTVERDAGDKTVSDSRKSSTKRSPVSPAPLFKDFLVMYATPPGYFAWRRTSGSWFVQSLHAVFTNLYTPKMSLNQALTRVAQMVAQGFESQNTGDSKPGKKQVPVIESMLIKDVYFRQK